MLNESEIRATTAFLASAVDLFFEIAAAGKDAEIEAANVHSARAAEEYLRGAPKAMDYVIEALAYRAATLQSGLCHEFLSTGNSWHEVVADALRRVARHGAWRTVEYEEGPGRYFTLSSSYGVGRVGANLRRESAVLLVELPSILQARGFTAPRTAPTPERTPGAIGHAIESTSVSTEAPEVVAPNETDTERARAFLVSQIRLEGEYVDAESIGVGRRIQLPASTVSAWYDRAPDSARVRGGKPIMISNGRSRTYLAEWLVKKVEAAELRPETVRRVLRMAPAPANAQNARSATH